LLFKKSEQIFAPLKKAPMKTEQIPPNLRKIQLYTFLLSIAIMPLFFLLDTGSNPMDAGTYITMLILIGLCQLTTFLIFRKRERPAWPSVVYNCLTGYLLGFFIAISAALILA
jgi:hypothetical protein